MHDIKSVFKGLNGLPYQMACFPRDAIRVALLYSGFISGNIKAFRKQKFSRIPLGCKGYVFLEIRDLGSPTIYVYYNQRTEYEYVNIQLMHSFEVNIRICQPEKVMSTEAKPRWTSLSRVDKS